MRFHRQDNMNIRIKLANIFPKMQFVGQNIVKETGEFQFTIIYKLNYTKLVSFKMIGIDE